MGVCLFSDIGIDQGLIYSKRATEPRFYNTAWTLKLVQGLVILVLLGLLAGPFSAFLEAPEARELLPIVGLSGRLAVSTRVQRANRLLQTGKIAVFEFSGALIGLVVTLVGAFIYPSVLALVLGQLAGELGQLVLSFTYLKGEKNRLCWDRTTSAN